MLTEFYRYNVENPYIRPMILYKTIYFWILPSTDQLWHWGTFDKMVLYSTTFNMFVAKNAYTNSFGKIYDISDLTLFIVVVLTRLKFFKICLHRVVGLNWERRTGTPMFYGRFVLFYLLTIVSIEKQKMKYSRTTCKYEPYNVFDGKMFDLSKRPRRLSEACFFHVP